MKKLIILFGIAFIAANSFSQPKRIKDLDRQNTYLDSARIVIDYTSFDSARFITAKLLAPKIDEENNSTSALDKDVYYMRINVTGAELKTSLRYINPDIANLNAETTIATTDLLTIYDQTSLRDEKITYSNFLTDLVAEAIFGTGVDNRFGNATFDTETDARITIVVTENFINNLITTNVSATDLYEGATKVCELSLQLIDQAVTGFINVTTNTSSPFASELLSSAGGSIYYIPSGMRPIYSCEFKSEVGSDNIIHVYGSGKISADFNEATTSFGGIGFSYIIP